MSVLIALSLLSLLSLLSAAPSSPSAEETQQRDEFVRIVAATRPSEAGAPELDKPEVAAQVRQLWALLGRRAATALQAHPDLEAQALAKHLLDLEAEANLAAQQRSLSVTAVRLASGEHAAYVVSVEWNWTGTFFIVARRHEQFEVVWSIKDVADAHFALKDELGYWAFGSSGYHDGPLSGEVHALPSGHDGVPRFYVDADTHPSMGLVRPAQISIWEWDGASEQPHVLFIKTYEIASGLSSELKGDRLQIRANTPLKTTSVCGSCENAPTDVWTLQLTPTGVKDLGRRPEDPELAWIDEVLFRLTHEQDVSKLVTPLALTELNKLMDDDVGSGESAYVGMLGSWKAERHGATSTLDMETDTFKARFTLARNGNQFLVTDVKSLAR
jgi:hypothetical protein